MAAKMNALRIKLALKRILRRLDEFTDSDLRRYYASRYGVDIGMYSYGCFDFLRFNPGTKIGRYCSISATAVAWRRNHGLSYLGLTPYFYNASMGVVRQDLIHYLPLIIEDDVWIGHNATILPSVSLIGRGAAIAAGAVVTHDVPAYAVVAGVPARVVRFRFDEATTARIEASQWWLLTPAALAGFIDADPQFAFEPGQNQELR